MEGLQDSRISQKIRKGKEEISPLSELNPFLFYKSGLQINSKTTNDQSVCRIFYCSLVSGLQINSKTMISLCVEHLL